MNWLRALVAFPLSILFPGAGHALIRDWTRALLFAGLYVSAVAIFLPVGELSAAGSVSEVTTIVVDQPRLNQAIIWFLPLFTAIDAGFRALVVSSEPATTDAPSCPHCGRELDADLEFCHWCTTRLSPEEDEAVNS